ncbi:MAG: acyltransferase [Mucilaginibacter sp.]|uniref:acyltransferase n=1 Tax=Mucilaginibacter sp. TaxID=1882438 RepID=UPI0031B25913
MKYLKYIILSPYRYLANLFAAKYNLFVLKQKRVEFVTSPTIIGKMKIINNGRCKLGEKVTFKSALSSNMVGLYKACTIAVTQGAVLEIGDHSGFSGVSIYCSNSIKIGKYVNCGGNVCIWDTDFHPLDYEARRVHDISKINNSPIVIGDDAFIGANSIILKGVTIGERSIVGAGSVVTKSIPANQIWAGNPAKFIRMIDGVLV